MKGKEGFSEPRNGRTHQERRDGRRLEVSLHCEQPHCGSQSAFDLINMSQSIYFQIFPSLPNCSLISVSMDDLVLYDMKAKASDVSLYYPSKFFSSQKQFLFKITSSTISQAPLMSPSFSNVFLPKQLLYYQSLPYFKALSSACLLSDSLYVVYICCFYLLSNHFHSSQQYSFTPILQKLLQGHQWLLVTFMAELPAYPIQN